MLSFTAILPAVRRSNTSESVYTRVLAALRHFDWATGAEVIEAMNADTREAVTARTALAYFTRRGLLDVRGRRNEQQWRLNVAALPRKAGGTPRHVAQPGECTHSHAAGRAWSQDVRDVSCAGEGALPREQASSAAEADVWSR